MDSNRWIQPSELLQVALMAQQTVVLLAETDALIDSSNTRTQRVWSPITKKSIMASSGVLRLSLKRRLSTQKKSTRLLILTEWSYQRLTKSHSSLSKFSQRWEKCEELSKATLQFKRQVAMQRNSLTGKMDWRMSITKSTHSSHTTPFPSKATHLTRRTSLMNKWKCLESIMKWWIKWQWHHQLSSKSILSH